MPSADGRGDSQRRPLLTRGTLWDRLCETTVRALAAGALQPIPTDFDYVEDGGVRFLVRILTNLARKDEERWSRQRQTSGGREANPFLPCEEDLFVAKLTEGHLCLLNKFNVVEHHLLIVTEGFEEQEDYLTTGDFAALLTALGEYGSLAFYNGGVVAGASQRHKHLQIVPLPLAAEGPPVPVGPVVAAALGDSPVGRSGRLPFRHAVAPVDPRWIESPGSSAPDALGTFHLLLRAAGMEEGDAPRSRRQSMPYNLLVTREWMFLVPRSREHFDGVSVNALGFAGALLVRNAAEMEALKERGPLEVLRSVAFAAGGG